MKPGDLVELNDVATAYVINAQEHENSCYGVLLDCRDYVFEQDPPLEYERETVWRVLVKKEVHDILERDLVWKGSIQK